MAAAAGTAVAAAADGTVTQAGWYEGYGRLVIIDHGNGYQTYYGHLSRVDVLEGQSLRQGELVGAVGTSGHSTGPHLHYEVRIGGVPVNPYRFLSSKSTLQAVGSEQSSMF